MSSRRIPGMEVPDALKANLVNRWRGTTETVWSPALAQPKPTRAPKAPRKQLTRTPLKRGKPLRAKRWGIKYKRPRRLDGPGADPVRLAAVAEMPCVLSPEWPFPWFVSLADGPRERTPCDGRIHVCHEGKTPGTSMRCPDSQTMPMCERHHLNEWGGARGFFRRWGAALRRAWADLRIAETTSLFLSHGGRRGR